MKRTTVFLDESLERELQTLARRMRRPMASIVREALAQYVVDARTGENRRLGFVAAGRSGHHDTADRHEELLWEEAAHGRARDTARPRRPRRVPPGRTR